MAYEVLARKWRPGEFSAMAGQEHVLRALVNGLETGRLHHAYLFTGTRGVGKTTVARILARCLNCEEGVGPNPCGSCSSCLEIAEGRFVDLIEVDAASRTKVEDTRELLENVQYAPTRGRYKVYLIDEVHMLSTSSFNALLKTLEEPPPHVKFLLATTDPRKLPVTVLSRCLQFHLKNLTPDRIQSHLAQVLAAEGISAEPEALWALARAADGSMRDALSLTDQAISFGAGALVADDVARMLGTIDQSALQRLLEALAAGEAQGLLDCAADLAEHAADFSAVLGDLMSVLHRVAVAQALPDSEAPDADGDAQLVREMSTRIAAEDLQLYYQMALTGVRDLPFAPDARTGFEMTLLRMLAFRPDDGGGRGAGAPSGSGSSAGAASGSKGEGNSAGSGEGPAANAASTAGAAAPEPSAAAPATAAPSAAPPSAAPPIAAPPSAAPPIAAPPSAAPPSAAPSSAAPSSAAPAPAEAAPAEAAAVRPSNVVALDASSRRRAPATEPADGSAGGPAAIEPDDWHAALPQLQLEGLTARLAEHCMPVAVTAERLELCLEPEAETLLADVHVERITAALERVYGRPMRLQIRVGAVAEETPAARAVRQQRERQQAAEAAIEADPNVRALLEAFDGRLLPDSIRPRGR